MPRLTESKGTAVTVFVQIPHKREQRLFGAAYVCVFSEKNRAFGRNLAFHSSLLSGDVFLCHRKFLEISYDTKNVQMNAYSRQKCGKIRYLF